MVFVFKNYLQKEATTFDFFFFNNLCIGLSVSTIHFRSILFTDHDSPFQASNPQIYYCCATTPHSATLGRAHFHWECGTCQDLQVRVFCGSWTAQWDVTRQLCLSMEPVEGLNNSVDSTSVTLKPPVCRAMNTNAKAKSRQWLEAVTHSFTARPARNTLTLVSFDMLFFCFS